MVLRHSPKMNPLILIFGVFVMNCISVLLCCNSSWAGLKGGSAVLFGHVMVLLEEAGLLDDPTAQQVSAGYRMEDCLELVGAKGASSTLTLLLAVRKGSVEFPTVDVMVVDDRC
jgi:hypothetical protein